jgi:hypothetical protein
MSNWNDFNDAEQQPSYELIPKGTVVKLRMTIKPGGHDNIEQGWTGGYATESFDTGSVYLSCEFVVLEGEYAKRKLWSNVGLHSAKGPAWGNMGRSFIRAVLNSARGVHPQDNSPQAAAARRIRDFNDLDGIEFVAKVDVEKDNKGENKNVIKQAIEPDHRDYAAAMGRPSYPAAHAPSYTPQQAPQPAAPMSQPAAQPQQRAQAPVTKPAWAQ